MIKTLNLGVSSAYHKIFQKVQPLFTETSELQKKLFSSKSRLEEFIRGATTGWPKFAAPLRTLAKHGWFISFSHTPIAWIYPLARLFQANEKERANRRLREHFGRRLDDIERRLLADFPRRRKVLRKAFHAHRNGDYELCIPVFLAQADGIAREIIGVQKFSIYSRHQGKVAKLQEFIDSVVYSDFQRELLELVLFTIPLNASAEDFIVPKGYLNRHEVLHGTNTSYASATNSYRAISWLQYVAYFKHEKKLMKYKKRQKKGPRELE